MPPAPARPTPYLALAALTLALLLPFLNKAFHIDDPLFLWAARQIQAHPGDPYGFYVNWYNRVDPMYVATENPPLASYYLAGAAALLGWSELAMHFAMLLPAIGAILGTYRLARRLCPRPVLAALVVLAAPVFLLSRTTVMCDVLMLCLWVWALVLWIEGLDARHRWVSLAALTAAAILIAAAALTKYFGISLIPLLLVYTLARRRYLPILALLIPVAALAAYQLWTAHLYGHGLLSEPISYVTDQRTQHDRPPALVVLNLLSFTGGCLLPVMLVFPMLASHRLRWLALALFALVLLALARDRSGLVMALNGDAGLNQALAVQIALFTVGGLAVILLLAQELAQHHDADAILLGLWVVGTLVFAGFLNWSVNGRSILPIAPAVGILLARRWEARATHPHIPEDKTAAWPWLIPLGLSATIAFALAWADQSVANVNRTAAREITRTYASPAHRLWFEGHWGFQYYAQKSLTIVPNTLALPTGAASGSGAAAARGAASGGGGGGGGFQYNVHAGEALPSLYGEDGNYVAFHPGDLVAIALNNSGIRTLPEDFTTLRAEFVRPVTPWLSVHSGFTGAGFYADYWGSAPFVFGPSMPEQYTILEITRPLLGISESSQQPKFEIRINQQ